MPQSHVKTLTFFRKFLFCCFASFVLNLTESIKINFQVTLFILIRDNICRIKYYYYHLASFSIMRRISSSGWNLKTNAQKLYILQLLTLDTPPVKYVENMCTVNIRYNRKLTNGILNIKHVFTKIERELVLYFLVILSAQQRACYQPEIVTIASQTKQTNGDLNHQQNRELK